MEEETVKWLHKKGGGEEERGERSGMKGKDKICEKGSKRGEGMRGRQKGLKERSSIIGVIVTFM